MRQKQTQTLHEQTELRIVKNVMLRVYGQMSTSNSNTYVYPTNPTPATEARKHSGTWITKTRLYRMELLDKHMYCCCSYSSDH